MANIPTPESYDDLNADMLSSYASELGVNDFNVSSAVTQFFSVVALVAARSSGDIFQILRDFSVDRATGEALKRLAKEYRVEPITAAPATGPVSIIDVSFEKISTKVYAGANPPNIGSTQIKVSDASLFTPTGSVYIGRGTNNIEGPLPYSSIAATGGFYTITLTTPTTKFHNVGETIILAQGGNRTIQINTVAISPSVGSTPDLQFATTVAAVILDGETQVDGVPVSAQTTGAESNVPAGAIRSFATPPFSGATVTNPLPFTTGADSETDDQLRVRIKRALASTGLGTPTAIQSAVIGATPSDEAATIVSASVLRSTSGDTLFIDSGDGYEAKVAGVGLESIVDSAIGGEQFFQLATGGRQAPIVKAFLQSTIAAPFDLIGGDVLSIIVGGQTDQHVFDTADFRSPGGATAFEVTASVNANTTLGFEATTSGGGQFVVLRAKNEGNDSIQTSVPTIDGRDASVLMGFPSNEIQTLRIYKNNIPLSKDGKVASIFSQSQQLWSNTIANGDTLVLSVDGTALITFTILDSDFVATGLYNTVSASNTLESWVEVFNSKLTGVTVQVVGQQLQIVSNLGANNRAKLSIDSSSTLVSKGMFSSIQGLTAQGAASDLILDRNTAQFELVEPLVAGDKLAAGSTETEARIESAQIPGGSVTLTADGHIWILFDSDGKIITNGVSGNTTISVSLPAANIVQYASSVSTAFVNVQVGDYVIIWSAELDPSQRLEGRVYAVTNDTLQIRVTPTEWAAVTTSAGSAFTDGFVTLRTNNVPQKFRVQAGTNTLDQISQQLQAQTQSLNFSVLSEQYLVVRSKTKDGDGSLLIVTADSQGKLLGFTAGNSDVSKTSLIAFYESTDYDSAFPLFIHSAFSAGSFANPIDSYISSVSSSMSLAGRDPNELISVLQPYGAIADAQPFNEYVQETSISGTTIGIAKQPDIRRVRSQDRYFLANPLDFGNEDTAVVVLDGDTTNKSFEIPFYRRAITNTSQPSNSSTFNAYDVDSGSAANFVSAFGATFDFSNFKVLMQAKKTLKPTPSKTAILYRSTPWGRSGEKVSIGYVYPPVANSEISSIQTVNSAVQILISLKSGAPITTAIDGSTEWNVSITPNTPTGVDQVTFTYNGTGSPPALSLSGGEYVTINTSTEFDPANTGTFRVSTQSGFNPSSTSFTVTMPTGTAVAESNKATLVPNAIVFYQSSPTTAAEIQQYVADNLAFFLSATLVLDGDMTGSGVIVLSTYEDSGFTSPTVTLMDGINWIQTSNLGSSPQFSLKSPLSLPTDFGYAFNSGEEVRLVPTTMDQVARLISILAVSGFTTIGTVGLVDRGTKLELATDVIGSGGALQIIGGSANEYSVPVLDSATRIDNTNSMISVDRVSGSSILSDQWFKLQATEKQAKDAFVGSNTSVTIVGQSPTNGLSTVQLLNRTLTQRYFGVPRHNVRVTGNTFRVEKQGSLVCISWNNVGTSPQFLKTLNFNDTAGGTLNIFKVTGTNEVVYQILTGNANFTELSIGELVTISGMVDPENNGTFQVTGVSENGKMVRVLNPISINQYSTATYTFSANSTAGDTFTVGGTALIAGTDFPIGATTPDTATNLAAAIGTLSGVTAASSGNVVTVTGAGPAATTTIAYSGTAVVTVSSGTLVGGAFVQGSFVAQTSVSEGDTVVIGSPFAVLNQGKFRVVRRFNDSIWIENENVVPEEVVLTANTISLGVDATTSLKVTNVNNKMYMNWNGVGTEPALQNALLGDVITFGTNFAVSNRGSFMVTRSGEKLQQITQIIVPTGLQFVTSGVGTYFKINSAGNINQYYVWFNVNAGNSDPTPVGLTGVQVAILSSDSASQVAAKVVAAITSVTVGLVASATNGTVTVTTSGFVETDLPVNVSVPAPFSISLTQVGRRTFVEVLNPAVSNESAVFVSGVLTCNRPAMIFTEYEGTVAGDEIAINGTVLGTTNAGSYAVARVLDRNTAIVVGNLLPITNVSLNNNPSALFVREGVAYSGYKHILLTASQPSAPQRTNVTFDTNAQYEKINESAGVELTSLSKLDFPTTVRKGLDSYTYNTGLIAEANRIIYGDPRDSVSYPGVGAAGADVFVREPLTYRVQVSVDVRLQTGAPFSIVAQQIRSQVAALINSNPVGKSIDISSIIGAARAVSGVQSVAIDSPQYDSTHDLIALTPGQKARILDPSIDISVSSIN